MKKLFIRISVICLLTAVCLAGAVYADTSSLPGSIKLPSGGTAVTPGKVTDDMLLANPDLIIPGISDIFKDGTSQPASGASAETQAQSQAAAPGTGPQIVQGKHNIYLRIDGIGNPGTYYADTTHRGELAVKSFELVGAESGGAREPYLKIIKPVDTASSRLLTTSMKAMHEREAILTIYKASYSNKRILKIRLWDLQIPYYKLTVDAQNPGEAVDELHISFSRIEYEMTTYKEDGSIENVNTFRYDVKTKQSF